MTLMDPRLQVVFNLLPNKCPSVFIAGGAAVDYDKASDIDIWFCNNNMPAALKFITAMGGVIMDKPNPYGKMNSYIVGSFICDKTVQVMVSTYSTAQETVDDFDISTHMFGYLSTGNKVVGKHYTDLTKPPVVVHTNPKTLERYNKICTRYGFEPDSLTVMNLQQYELMQKLIDEVLAEEV